jgi:hypothetical protein
LIVGMPEPRPVAKQREEGAMQFGTVGFGPQVSPLRLPDIPVLSFPQKLPPPAAIQARAHEPGEQAKPTGAVGKEARSPGLAASLKRKFRATVRALFKRTPSPQPQARRRRTGETVGTFRMVARNLLRPIIRLPPISRAVEFLNETLSWLHLWEWNETTDHDSARETPNGDDNHLSPHP